MYIYIYLYIYIYWKKECNVLHSFAKERNVLAFFSVFCKRTKHSLRSFTFFAKERNILCILFCSKEKNGKECIVLLGFISRQKLKKERKRTLRSLKERSVQNGKERGAQPFSAPNVAVKVAVTKDLVAVNGPKVAVVFGWSGSEGFWGSGNPAHMLLHRYFHFRRDFSG